jgi:glutathione synthase
MSKNNTKKMCFIIDPIETLNHKKDTTIALIEAAFQMGFEIFCCTLGGLIIKNNMVYANCIQINYIDYSVSNWYRSVATDKMVALNDFETVWMRKDPPFDLDYIYSTYLLDFAIGNGARVRNNPTTLRNHNEKLSTLLFKQYIPQTLVSSNAEEIKEFIADQGKVVIKPMDSMGGTSVFLVSKEDVNQSVIIETITQLESRHVMIQKFIPEIKAGDKRVLLINGNPYEYGLARVPKTGDFRGNLAKGATAVGFELNAKELEISKTVGQFLLKNRVVFAGIDIIGGYLTEINITSPTCVRELQTLYKHNLATQIIEAGLF